MVGATMTLRFGYLVSRRLRLLRALGGVVVAVDGVDELEALVLVLGEGRLHELDPLVLVGRGGGRRQDRDLAGAVRGELAGPVGEVHADAAEVDLVDEDVVRADGRARVEADDLDARPPSPALRAGATSSLPSAEMMIALTPWVVRSVMNGICRSALASFGPTWMTVPPVSPARLVDAGLRGGEVLVDDVLRQVADGDRPGGRPPSRPPTARPTAGAGACCRRPVEHAANTMTATLARAIDSPDCSELQRHSSSILRGCCLTMWNRVGRRGPTSADSIDGRLGLVSKGWDDDREDQEQPEGDALDLDRHAGEPQRVLHDRDREDREDDAGDRPATRRRC